jgi:probable rRNA maturation factor
MFDKKLYIDFSATKEFDECDYYFKSVIRQAVIKTLEYEDFLWNAEVSVTFCDNAYIRSLNKEYRKKDKATDVLSFPSLDGIKGKVIKKSEHPLDIWVDGSSIFLGSIIICEARAKEQAEEYGHSLEREVCYLVLHGILHCFGYDHIQPDDEKEMSDLAEKIMNELNLKRD